MSGKEGHPLGVASVHSSPGGSRGAATTHWFTSEIQQMMHGFGDCRRPLHESAALVEEIVHQQMATLLYRAADVTAMRSGRYIGMEDILFLMRKDQVKLRRLLRYLDMKDLKTAALRGAGLDEEEATEPSSGDKIQPPIKRRRKICYDFLSSIDQTGELLALFDNDGLDEVKHERLLRAELQSRGMDHQHYLEFCESRQVNFSRKYKLQRFKDWLMAKVHLDVKPNPMALEVISYLAYETIAQVVDLTLLVKQDMRAQVEDPLIKNMSSTCTNYHDGVPLTLRSTPTPGTQTPLSGSPPSTPTTGTGLGQSTTPGSGGSGQGNTPGSAGKSKPKKRKKSGHANAEVLPVQPIQPTEVREAIRRFGQSIGPFATQNRVNHQWLPRMILMCC